MIWIVFGNRFFLKALKNKKTCMARLAMILSVAVNVKLL